MSTNVRGNVAILMNKKFFNTLNGKKKGKKNYEKNVSNYDGSFDAGRPVCL